MATVNPLKLLLKCLQGTSLGVLRVRQDCMQSSPELRNKADLLRLLTPTGSSVILWIELPGIQDTVAASMITETADVGHLAGDQTDMLDRSRITENVTISFSDEQ